MRLFLFTCFIFLSVAARADYLAVNRTGNLRSEPSVESEVLEKLTVGDKLILQETEQTNGYYHVRTTTSGQEGWVYRTLVRRVAGDINREDLENLSVNSVAEVRVVDVGAGLCNLIKLPGSKYVIYDAGGDFNVSGERTASQIKEYIPERSEIELMILSHTDADHIIAATQVLRDYKVKKVLWSGFEGSMVSGNSTQTYLRFCSALNSRIDIETVNLNALDSIIQPGTSFSIDAARFTFLCGFGNPLDEWELNDRGELINSVSIVMKMEFGGNSVLFCGDAVGRHRDDNEDALIATEKFLVDEASGLLPSTVLIAPHHGARNGSSAAFVDLVKPKAVIFSAGHKHHHPTTRTANLYLEYVDASQIFRTDRGDDEGAGEWNFGRIRNCRDKFGDDTIQIQLRSNGSYRIFYINPQNICD